MIYGAINEKGEEYYTDMSRVFESIKNRQRDYNWLITDCECICDTEISKTIEQQYCWISGEDLTDLVMKNRIQWVWAVLSAFDKSVTLPEVLKYDLPRADGYPGFWKKPLSVQHPLAQIEIAAFDSSCTLLFCKEKEVVDSFLKYFPQSEPLEDYIK